IPLDVLYEDDELVAINKPANMVVHPARGHWSGTLTAALAFHFRHLSSLGGPARPGVVHRLDRETSGVILIAKNDLTHFSLTSQFAKRTIEKEYLAIVVGRPEHDRDVIEAPIGVHPYQREKMAIRAGHTTSRPARSYYEVVERFRGFAAVRVVPHTGRTHQIRLHLCHIGCPVLCDRLYGGRGRVTRGELVGSADAEAVLERHALHARRLRFAHPTTGATLEIQAPIPADMEAVLAQLRELRSATFAAE
ncbi:MAG: RluA family pseudouridine synthase, partial [Pirellulaceae bacterium]